MESIDKPEKEPKKRKSMVESIINDSNKGEENGDYFTPMAVVMAIGFVIYLIVSAL